MAENDVDVLIVGAGLSGIGAAYHLQNKCPGKSYAILEARDAIGGTWDLFRYPGIRSDSDMHTLGYNFKPWTAQKAIADGPAILDYVRETAAENGIDRKIRYNHKVVSASWDSAKAVWTVTASAHGEPIVFTARFLHMCSGYFRYDKGYMPDFPGLADFKGELVHPQSWPEDLDYAGKTVLVIGSGATAMTLVPAMAETAAHVTMLQRSPTYVVSRPAEDKFANWMRRWLPPMLAYGLTRWRNVLLQLFFYDRSQKRPERVKELLIDRVKEELGPDYDVETHFTPSYNPWDQRLCLVPDGDLFEAIKQNKASIVTDHIDHFNETGVRLKSGDQLDADIIVSATGLDLQFAGGVELSVDGETIVPNELLNYRGCMISNIPNLLNVFGYTNASWTLRADLTSEYLCRLINHMDKENFVEVRPVVKNNVEAEDFLDFSSGYVRRAVERFPKRGTEAPWVLNQNYAKDILLMRHGPLNDGALIFRRAHETIEQVAGLDVAAA